jgi:aspartate--ammonia ligase
MSQTQTITIPNGYHSFLSPIQTEVAIQEIKHYFEMQLNKELNVIKVSAPLLLKEGEGINDNLSGVERIVSFKALDMKDERIELVQSLAKWKRIALKKYGLSPGEGIYTNMNAVRRDEILDNIHSMYVDQWDWEKVINKDDRSIKTLKMEVERIYRAFQNTEEYLHTLHPKLEPVLPKNIYFITTQQLENLYPNLSPKAREDAITKKYGAVFLMQIGGLLRSGQKHDERSPDYDDWTLNGDILVWNSLLEQAFELSSMGIRVDGETLLKQLQLTNEEKRTELAYHRLILNNSLPHSIGGGIGQSRLYMFILKKAHIGEVQAAVWNEQIIKECQEKNIHLL